jgi:glycosyltransferase involved in cell wall biosynthesis
VGHSPLVSIIMPFHNTPPAFMEEAIQSVVQQSYTNWELWLIDDGSEGTSTQVALRYSEQHRDRIRYLEHEDHRSIGASASRQAAIERANGTYVALLDADDVWIPEKLEQQVAILETQPEAAMLYGNTLYWYSWTGEPADRARDFLPSLGLTPNRIMPGPELLAQYLQGKAAVPCTCSVIVRRKVLELTGGFDTQYSGIYDDQIFYTKICLRVPIYVADKCWDKYRRNPQSMTSVVSTSRQLHDLRLEYLRWLEDYVVRHGFDDRKLLTVIRQQLWWYEYPQWLGESDEAMNLLRWAKKWALRLDEAIMPAAVRSKLWGVEGSGHA